MMTPATRSLLVEVWGVRKRCSIQTFTESATCVFEAGADLRNIKSFDSNLRVQAFSPVETQLYQPAPPSERFTQPQQVTGAYEIEMLKGRRQIEVTGTAQQIEKAEKVGFRCWVELGGSG